MGKGKETSLDLRQKVIDLKKKEHLGYKSIAKKLNMPLSTVRSIVKKYDSTGLVENIRRTGRPQKLPDGVQQYLLTQVMKEKHSPAEEEDEEQRVLDTAEVTTATADRLVIRANLHQSILVPKPSVDKATQNR